MGIDTSKYAFPLGALLFLLSLSACVTTPPQSNPPNSPESTFAPSANASSQGPNKELSAARGMMRAGNYSQAIPRLTRVANSAEGSDTGVEAHFLLGQAYFELGGYADAYLHFQKSLELAPEGNLAPWCRDYLSRLTGPEGTQNGQNSFTETRVRELGILMNAEPEELAYPLELAELYWKSARYEEAGAVYDKIFVQWPKLMHDMVLRQRIVWESEGVYTVLTPDEVLRRHSDAEPLLVYGTNAFRSGRYQGYTQSFRETQYNVTGKVANRGAVALANVTLHITIYGFGDKVYDTKQISIGNLAAGNNRAFNAVFENFDDINNITRYEIQSDFERRN